MAKHKEFFNSQQYQNFKSWCKKDLPSKELKVWEWCTDNSKTTAEYYLQMKSEEMDIWSFC